MAQPALAIGNDFIVTIHGVTKNIGSFRITDSSTQTEFKPLDTLRTLRRTTGHDCSIAVTGYESGTAGAGTFAMLDAAKLNNDPLDDLGWDVDTATPTSMLPTEFFTMYPLTEWRIRSVTGGPTAAGDGVTWEITLTPGEAA